MKTRAFQLKQTKETIIIKSFKSRAGKQRDYFVYERLGLI